MPGEIVHVIDQTNKTELKVNEDGSINTSLTDSIIVDVEQTADSAMVKYLEANMTLLTELIKEIKIMNLHLESMTDEGFTREDI